MWGEASEKGEAPGPRGEGVAQMEPPEAQHSHPRSQARPAESLPEPGWLGTVRGSEPELSPSFGRDGWFSAAV